MLYIKSSRWWIATTVIFMATIVFDLFMLYVPAAHAETPYDITNCYDGTSTDLYRTKELTITTTDMRGISRSNHENKVFDNCSFHSVQILQIANGNWKRFGHTKFIDPDGDYFFVEVSGEKDAVVKFLYGTGKWNGITGAGKFERLTDSKAIEPNTFQGCVRNTGTFELPK